jgi:methionine-rich copper-binding protein CopC
MKSLLAALLACLPIVLLPAGFAFAHNVLISSDPKDGSTVNEGPSSITLTFDQPVQAGERFNTFAVTGPGNTRWETETEPAVSSNSVIFSLRPLGPAGEYQVGYRVLSADGHPVTGSIKFTVTVAGSGTPAPPNANMDKRVAETENGVPIWVWIGGAIVLLGAGIFIALRGVKPDNTTR